MTQTEYDLKILSIAEHEVRMAYSACQMRRQNDPAANDREVEIMMLQNILYGLRNYDIDSDILTDAEIDEYFALSTQIIQNCPL